jgi:hypothetical protein
MRLPVMSGFVNDEVHERPNQQNANGVDLDTYAPSQVAER